MDFLRIIGRSGGGGGEGGEVGGEEGKILLML